MRQPPAPSRHPAGRVRTARLARAPSSAAPRASLPFTGDSLARGRHPLDLEDAISSNRRPDTAPREAGWRPNPSRSSAWSLVRQLSPASESTPGPLTFVTGPSSVDPPLRGSGSVVGPPVARWAGSHGISSLVDPARWCERRNRC